MSTQSARSSTNTTTLSVWGAEVGKKSRNLSIALDDEFLVKPEMFDKVFRPFGITSRPVLDYKSRSVLRTVVQLEIPLRADVDVANAAYRVCELCGERNYARDSLNYAPMP